MKKALFTIACFLFCLNANCQNLTFYELIHLYNRTDIPKYLNSKSFVITQYHSTQGEPIDFYVINGGTDKEEKINVSDRGVYYTTRNVAYVNSLVKQIKNKYHKISGFDEPNYKLYQFGDPYLLITVNVEKGKSSHS